ncbi:MAG: hypothetical protein OWQ54_06285 [Sulfolobaceae archaeon]|nr:hypothetical protein [Sulfolobaceae archaeon]
MTREILKNKIIELLKRKDMTSIELRNELLNEIGNLNAVEFRETLAELVKEGIVEKYPVYEKKKFYFRLKSS